MLLIVLRYVLLLKKSCKIKSKKTTIRDRTYLSCETGASFKLSAGMCIFLAYDLLQSIGNMLPNVPVIVHHILWKKEKSENLFFKDRDKENIFFFQTH